MSEVLQRRGYSLGDCQPDNADLHHVGSELREYIAGECREFTFPLDFEGTEFQRAVWGALLAIPYGETHTYGEIAKSIDNPKASRQAISVELRTPVIAIIPKQEGRHLWA